MRKPEVARRLFGASLAALLAGVIAAHVQVGRIETRAEHHWTSVEGAVAEVMHSAAHRVRLG